MLKIRNLFQKNLERQMEDILAFLASSEDISDFFEKEDA